MAEEHKEETVLPTLKKEHSYTYWVDQKNKSRELPEQHKPKKINNPAPIAQNTTALGPSKWNSSGTWEQRTVSTKELNQAINSALLLWLAQAQCELTLKQVELQGEFKQIFSNKKRKILYEISGTIKFQGDDLQLKITELTCSGDREFSVKGKNGEEKRKLESAAEKIMDLTVQTFNSFRQ